MYDLLGREIIALVDEFRKAGAYEIELDAENLSSGIYIYRLTAGKYSSIKKMVLIK